MISSSPVATSSIGDAETERSGSFYHIFSFRDRQRYPLDRCWDVSEACPASRRHSNYSSVVVCDDHSHMFRNQLYRPKHSNCCSRPQTGETALGIRRLHASLGERARNWPCDGDIRKRRRMLQEGKVSRARLHRIQQNRKALTSLDFGKMEWILHRCKTSGKYGTLATTSPVTTWITFRGILITACPKSFGGGRQWPSPQLTQQGP